VVLSTLPRALPADWTPHLHHMTHARSGASWAASVAIASSGSRSPVVLRRVPSPAKPEKIDDRLPGLYRWVRDKYYVDEFYERVFVEGLGKRFGRFLWEVDARVVDGVGVNGTSWLTVQISKMSAWFDLAFVDGAVDGIADTLQAAWRGYRRVQTGRTENYALTMAVGAFGAVCLWIILK
jgi:NADH:ubiquinone oxidoreductase subunit 5 (subunit L)/multisubunit Na+/H+ antiporter MnhA subunit